ncbi:MAG: phytoene/squalene synthase family protein [Xanthobacteraceae bacterium]
MNEAYAYCEALVRDADKDRYLAALFVPAAVRPHIFALYAFNAEVASVRERAREPQAGEVRLQWWREAVEGTRGSEAAANPVAVALLDTVERRSLARHLLSELVDGRSFDLYDDPMPTLAVLEAYVDATSGELIRLAASVLAGRRSGVVDAATHAGRAYAFTGLLRAFALHASRGQLYVPLDLLTRHGVTRDNAISGNATAGLLAALAEMRALARQHLDVARAHLKSVPPEAAPAFLPAALVPLYLSRMARSDYDPFKTPVEVPQWRRQWALWRAAKRGL